MPIHKPRNSREQEAVYLGRLLQLQAEGIDVEIPDEWSQRDRALDIIVAPSAVSMVFEFRNGGIGYAPFVRLTARAGLTITDSEITTKWDDQIVLESFRDPVCRLGNV